MLEKNVRKTKSNDGRNKYDLPEWFPNVIKYLDMFQEDERPERLKGVLCGGLMITPTGLWLMRGRDMFCEGISGVLAGRFNTNIYVVLEGLKIYRRCLAREIDEFHGWLSKKRDEQEKASQLARLKEEARGLGYVLTKP